MERHCFLSKLKFQEIRIRTEKIGIITRKRKEKIRIVKKEIGRNKGRKKNRRKRNNKLHKKNKRNNRKNKKKLKKRNKKY